jgi:hypothetical protein
MEEPAASIISVDDIQVSLKRPMQNYQATWLHTLQDNYLQT